MLIDKNIINFDGVQQLDFGKHLCFIHNEHRWVLPLIALAQDRGELDRPCNIVMFDYHRDDLVPRAGQNWEELLNIGVTIDVIRNLCENTLRKENDDWLIAGMELGLIQDAVLFCSSSDCHTAKCLTAHNDHRKQTHQIARLGLPKEEMGFKGSLFDGFTCSENAVIKEILGMTFNQGTLSFCKGSNLLLNIDLDFFKIDIPLGSEVYTIPWLGKMYENELTKKEEDYNVRDGISVATLVKQLFQNTGLITIASEPVHCGSEENSREIFRNVNRFLFENQIKNIP